MKRNEMLYTIGMFIGVLGIVISLAGIMLETMTIVPSMVCLFVATVLVTSSIVNTNDYSVD